MIYVVIDTNVIVSSLIIRNRESIPLKLLELIFQKKNHITPIFSEEIIQEYKEVLSRPKFNISKSRIGTFINYIKKIGILMDKAEIDDFVSDPKDVVFYQVVMEGRKTEESYLVTGNIKHFPKKTFVVTPSELFDILNK